LAEKMAQTRAVQRVSNLVASMAAMKASHLADQKVER
jgi:hypothetical protein